MLKISILKVSRLLLQLALTTFLILNIYVEITNHFDYSPFNETFIRSNLILEQSSQWMRSDLGRYANQSYDEPLQERAEKVSLIVERFMNYIDTIHSDLDKTVHNNAQWSLCSPKSKSQHYFFGGKMPQATQIKVKIAETHQQFIRVLESIHSLVRSKGGKPDEEIKQMSAEMLLKIEEQEDKQSWEAITFENSSVAACHMMLNKIQNDARSDEIKMIRYLASKVGCTYMHFIKYDIVSEPQKHFVWEGERFKTELFLTSSSQEGFPSDLCYFIDSTALRVENRKGIFETTTREAGEKSCTVHITAQIPFNPKLEHYSKTFKYEVIQPFVTCAAEQMNTIYIGVENPISVRAAGLSSSQMRVSATGCTLKSIGVGKFIATATAQGIAKIMVTTKDWHKTFTFQVKLPPNPVPTLNLKKSGEIEKTEMRVQKHISLEANDLDINDTIQSFTLVRIPHLDREHPIKTVVKSGIFDAAALQLVAAAEVGDWYYFEDIKVICSLNQQIREIGGMNFVVF
jgi:gliding motility-associated protein GldM